MSWDRIKATVVYYPTLAWNMLLGRWLSVRRWWDRVDEHVLLGAVPFRRDVPRLAAAGVRAVVNTCEEYPGPVDLYREYEIEQYRMPTVDFTHPLLEDVEGAVEFMNREIEQGHPVYVHCKAGRARSATVVMCWLIDNRQITAREAQQVLNEARPHVNPRLFERPVVREFERRHLRGVNGTPPNGAAPTGPENR